VTTKVDHNAGSLPAAEHRVELVQGVMASRFIDVGVDLLRGRGGGAAVRGRRAGRFWCWWQSR